jgi:hypothetical protein
MFEFGEAKMPSRLNGWHFALNLSEADKKDLVEYLKGIWTAKLSHSRTGDKNAG